jgi:hypothetical protein
MLSSGMSQHVAFVRTDVSEECSASENVCQNSKRDGTASFPNNKKHHIINEVLRPE